jgi:hypothetical protein
VSLNGHPQPFYLLEKFRRKVKLKIEKEVILREKIVNNNTIEKFGSHKVSIFLKNLFS